MSYNKMMKSWKNPRKYRKPQPMLFHVEGGFKEKDIWHTDNLQECPQCGYERPNFFFNDEFCDLCNSGLPLDEAISMGIHGKVEPRQIEE